jgi:hypothetical protein
LGKKKRTEGTKKPFISLLNSLPGITVIHIKLEQVKCSSVYWSQGDHKSVIPVWKLPVIVMAGYRVFTETQNSTQLLTHGNNLV